MLSQQDYLWGWIVMATKMKEDVEGRLYGAAIDLPGKWRPIGNTGKHRLSERIYWMIEQKSQEGGSSCYVQGQNLQHFSSSWPLRSPC